MLTYAALSKVVYEKLFAWLVGCINDCLQASAADVC
jgi:myosin heavy subunit